MMNKEKKPFVNKIRITGGSGSGKTYLGKKISAQIRIPLLSMDEVVYDFSKTTKFKHKKTEQETKKELDKIIKKNKWIIEGAYYELTKKTYDDADMIIFIDNQFLKRLINMHKRFIKNIFLGKYEGFRSFIELVKYNIKIRDKWRKERPKQFKEKYKNKIIFFKSADEAYEWFIKNSEE